MSRKFKTRALVVHRKRAGGADLFLRVLSADRGLLGCFARSARKQDSKLGPLLTPPALGELELVEGKSGDSLTVTGFEVEDGFPRTEDDYTATLIANFWTQVLTALPLGVELSRQLFTVSRELIAGAHTDAAPALLARAAWTLLDELGAVGGDPADAELLLIDPDDGSIRPPSEDTEDRPKYLALRPPALTALALALSPSGGSGARPGQLMDALDLLVPALEARLEKELSGWGMLRDRLDSMATGSL